MFSGQLVIHHNAEPGLTNVPIRLQVVPPDAAPGPAAGAPARFAIESIHPNPFNAAAEITFTLPSPGDVNLAVYDLAGRELTHVTEGFHPAGRYRVEIDAGNWASGVYIVRLQRKGSVRMSKMVCVK